MYSTVLAKVVRLGTLSNRETDFYKYALRDKTTKLIHDVAFF